MADQKHPKRRRNRGRSGVWLAVIFAVSLGAAEALAQQRLIGEVTAIDVAGGRMTVKTDAGTTVTFRIDDRTVFRRVPPGERTLDAAERITAGEVSAGDRVLLPAGEPGSGDAARQVIVMSRATLAESLDREREDWRARGIAGRVVGLDPARREIAVEARTREGFGRMTVVAANEVRFRRYALDSLRPADAVPGAFTDIRVGDQLRALGERSADGSRLIAEEIISGPLSRLSGVIASVDAGRDELTVRETQSGQTMVVTIGPRTTIRRLPEEFVRGLGEGRARGADRSSVGGRAQRDGTRPRERRGSAGEAGEGTRRQGRGVQQTLENLPTVTLGELKPGEGVFIMTTGGGDGSRITAASLLTGDAELLSRLQRSRQGQDGRNNMSPGLPGSVVGGGTGDGDEP